MSITIGIAFGLLGTHGANGHVYPPHFKNYRCQSGDPAIPPEYEKQLPFDWEAYGEFSTGSIKDANKICRVLDPYGYASNDSSNQPFLTDQYQEWECKQAEDEQYPTFCSFPDTMKAFLSTPPYSGYHALHRRSL
ncbi:hypothetical protein BJ684DRAFT_22212 [Piptocephalis cylindrospora]|uniref:Uncharacterized protein n=1 Tax=Piptocephalis cylindrospora TaxID=1907219 RepID=A0A4P9XY05_9FUNG|nr:hypothetical protein BJ684DRAFT_22212 [Piptocephalis cylindrospora]|eukprot:RKP11237.1 hypothetical protein BJ684DRAFT_22212 [Piptocephalis cylindrospora]